MAEVSNKRVILKHAISELPKESDLEVVYSTIKLKIPESTKDAVLVKNLYLACDAYMGTFMMYSHLPPAPDRPSYAPGKALKGLGVVKVIESTHPNYKVGDLAWGYTDWEEYTLIESPKLLIKIFDTGVPLSHYTGILGMPGVVAYGGFYDVCKPKEGEKIFISAAAGSIGQIVGQFAKLMGCYVVGSVGSQEKIDILKSIGFDEVINYKEEPDLTAALKRCFPEGIDMYFDNVGGKTLDAALANMRLNGRVALCGLMSQKGSANVEGIKNMGLIINNLVRVQGFTALPYFASPSMENWWKSLCLISRKERSNILKTLLKAWRKDLQLLWGCTLVRILENKSCRCPMNNPHIEMYE